MRLGVGEAILLLILFLLLFGGRKLPELAKGIGEALKNFKSAINDEDEKGNGGKK